MRTSAILAILLLVVGCQDETHNQAGRVGMLLSPRADGFVYCGLQRYRPQISDDIDWLVGDADWIASEKQEAMWGPGGFGGGSTQPEEELPDPGGEDDVGTSDRQIEHTKASLQRVLDGRLTKGQWRRMCSLLETQFYDFEELAVLEIFARDGEGGRYVILARTPRGCFAASDVGPWHVGALGSGDWDDTWRGQLTITTADPEATARFFREVREADEPNVLLTGMVGSLEHRPPLQAVLHVIWDKGRESQGDRDWRLALVDEDAWLLTWALAVEAPQLDPEAAALLSHPDDDPKNTLSRRWQDVMFAEPQGDDYERVRGHFVARLRQFWMTAMPPHRLTEQEYDRIVGQIAATRWVSGSAIGEGLDEGAYWQLSQGLLRVLSREEFRKMLTHRDMKVRAMGMYCLAQVDRAGSVDLLKARLGSRKTFTTIVFGCISGETTIGCFALSLLHNASYLDPISNYAFSNYAPLLSRPEQFGLDLEVLARDDCASSHWVAGNVLSWGLHEKEWELTLPAMRTLAPELSDVQLVKAIGRIRPEPATREFLLAMLASGSMDGGLRLAAGSALTRHVDPAAQEALAAAEKDLNQLADGAGTEVVRIARHRAEMAIKQKAYDAWSRKQPADRDEAEKDRMITELVELSAACPVAALEEERSRMSHSRWAVYGIELDSPALLQWQQAMLALSRRLGDFDQPWNTYGDLAWRLDLRLQGEWSSEVDGFIMEELEPEEEDAAFGGRLGRNNWHEIRSNVDKHLERREGSDEAPGGS